MGRDQSLLLNQIWVMEMAYSIVVRSLSVMMAYNY